MKTQDSAEATAKWTITSQLEKLGQKSVSTKPDSPASIKVKFRGKEMQ